MSKRFLRYFAGAALAVLVCGLTGSSAAEPSPIGKAYFERPDSPGLLDARPAVVAAGEIFLTPTARAVVHLDNGAVLRLEANSAARFVPAGEDTFEVTVLSGSVLMLGERDRQLAAGSGSVFKVRPSLEDPLQVEERLVQVETADPETGLRASPRRVEHRPAPAAARPGSVQLEVGEDR